MKILTDYERATLTAKKLYMLNEEKLNTIKHEKDKVYWRIKDEIRALESEMSGQMYEYEQKIEEIKIKGQEERAPYYATVKASELLFNLTTLHRDPTKVSMFDYSHTEENLVEVLYNDDYKKIGLFIIKNNKPVNCYTLEIYGISLFQHLDHNTHPEEELKDGPSEKSVLAWWEKNKVKRLKREWLSHQTEMEKKYKQVLELEESKEWHEAYLYYMKNYFEKNYSKAEETDMYKSIVEQIKILDTEPEDLPLLINDINTTNGKKALERKLKGELI